MVVQLLVDAIKSLLVLLQVSYTSQILQQLLMRRQLISWFQTTLINQIRKNQKKIFFFLIKDSNQLRMQNGLLLFWIIKLQLLELKSFRIKAQKPHQSTKRKTIAKSGQRRLEFLTTKNHLALRLIALKTVSLWLVQSVNLFILLINRCKLISKFQLNIFSASDKVTLSSKLVKILYQ